MRKRERLEIIHDMLSIILDKNNAIRKIPLMRFTNLSSQSFQDYFDEMIQKNLIKETYDKKNNVHISLTD